LYLNYSKGYYSNICLHKTAIKEPDLIADLMDRINEIVAPAVDKREKTIKTF